MYFDTHVHLNDPAFDGDRGAVLDRMAQNGVVSIVEIADEPAQWDSAVALSRARPGGVRCALGLHPYYADARAGIAAAALPRKALLPEVVAVGEIGLDYVKSPASPDAQRKALSLMLERAWDCGLPVIIHCRGAYRDLWPLLSGFYAGKRRSGRYHGVLHCFSGTNGDAQAAVRLGFALGIDGPITYPRNDGLRLAVREAGLDHIVLETDSPYLPPQSSRGRRNEPGAIAEIAEGAAKVFAVPVEEVARRTTLNARDLFPKYPKS